MKRVSQWIMAVCRSRRCFPVLVAIFALEAGYLACTSRFPMAFDEPYHYGLIQFFTHHLNPIITSQGSDTYRYGAIIQDPSFLYQYLLSFPFRVIDLFTQNFLVHLVLLRFINIALAVVGLYIMKRLLRRVGLSQGLSNVVLAAYMFTPIVTVLSAQVNYFNLLIPLFSLVAYLTLGFHDELRRGRAAVGSLVLLLSVSLLASLVAFAFLPVLLVVTLSLGWGLWRSSRQKAGLGKRLRLGWKRLQGSIRLTLCGLLVISCCLFGRIYGVNLVRYHSVAPQCNQVLNISACRHYYAWNRNYELRQKQLHDGRTAHRSIQAFTSHWVWLCLLYLFGEVRPLQGLYYVSVPYLVALALLGYGLLMVTLRYAKAWWRPETRLLLAISLVYLSTLWLRNYRDYLALGKAVAINGRYVVPVLVFLYAILALGAKAWLVRVRDQWALPLRASLVISVAILSIIFGGALPYVLYITPVYGRLRANDQTFMTTIWP